MSDERNDKLNMPDADEPSYTVDEILSEFSSFRSQQRVVPFPTQEPAEAEDEEELPVDPMPRRQRPQPQPRQTNVVGVPLSLVFKEKLRSLFRRADEYADQMYQQAEPTPDELEAEELIPGVDEEELPEEEEPRRRFRRKPAEPPHDTAPADLAARYRQGLRAGRLRLAPCFLLALAAAYVSLDFPLPELGISDYGLRLVFCTAALGLTILLCLDVIWAGLKQLFTLKPNVETLAALSALATLADALTMPSLGLRDSTLPCAAPACFVLFFNLWGRHLKRRADHQACRIASQAQEPWLLTVDDAKWSGRPAYTKWSGPLHGFGSQIQSPDRLQTVYRVISPLFLIACISCSVLASVNRGQNAQFLWSFSSTLTAAATFSAPLAYALPCLRLTRRLAKSNAALAGWPGVRCCREHSLILSDTDLFPTGAVKLNGIKIFGHFSNEKVIAYTSTLVRTSGCGLVKPFSDLMKAQNALYRPCTGITFHEGGITGVIHGQEVIVGTASFLRLMNVELPQGLHVKSALFCAIDGELAGIFAVYYDLRDDVSLCLSALLRNKLSPLLATRDPNLIPSFLKQKFKLPVERMEFPAVDRRMELTDPAQPHSDTLTAVFLREGLLPYSDAAIGGCRLRTAARLGTLLCTLGGVLGIILTFYLTFVDAYRSLSPAALLVFLFAWLIPQLVLGDWVTRY